MSTTLTSPRHISPHLLGVCVCVFAGHSCVDIDSVILSLYTQKATVTHTSIYHRLEALWVKPTNIRIFCSLPPLLYLRV